MRILDEELKRRLQMRKITAILATFFLVAVFAVESATANNFIPITAEQAFDAYANQEDPVIGFPANVAIVDIRSTGEHYWVGSCAQVDSIVTKRGYKVIPDKGKVNLIREGKLLKFKVSGYPIVLPIRRVESIETSPIAINIPYKTWDDENCEKPPNENFVLEIEALANEGIEVIILMCRSGKRSSECVDYFNTKFFDAVYEIDQPDGTNGRGGFQGTSYNDKYNGFRGFPGRRTAFQEAESVSWSDAGLPIHIGWCSDK